MGPSNKREADPSWERSTRSKTYRLSRPTPSTSISRPVQQSATNNCPLREVDLRSPSRSASQRRSLDNATKHVQDPVSRPVQPQAGPPAQSSQVPPVVNKPPSSAPRHTAQKDVPVIDLRSPSQSTRSKTHQRTNPIPIPLALKPHRSSRRAQQGASMIIHHRSQLQSASQSASQRRWLDNATRHVHGQPVPSQPVPTAQVSKAQATVCKPQVIHRPHPDSKVLQDFHWVPYPLGLLPYDSWHKLHNREGIFPPLPFRCPVCRKERKVNSHLRKAYLVAERLSWEDEFATAPDKNMNEELNWAVNYELGILEPFVEDTEHVPGGKRCQRNKFHPYRNEFEMKEALKLIFTSENITNASWTLWIGMQSDLQSMLGNEGSQASVTTPTRAPRSTKETMLPGTENRTRIKTPPAGIEEIDLTLSPDPASKHVSKRPASHLPTPLSSMATNSSAKARLSLRNHLPASAPPTPNETNKDTLNRTTDRAASSSKDMRIISYKTLQDFYSLLDQIERTSYVGALFLEAYAERLRDDMCKDCWFKRYVETDA